MSWCSVCFFFFSSRRRHTRLQGDWSSDVCSSDLGSLAILSWSRPLPATASTEGGLPVGARDAGRAATSPQAGDPTAGSRVVGGTGLPGPHPTEESPACGVLVDPCEAGPVRLRDQVCRGVLSVLGAVGRNGAEPATACRPGLIASRSIVLARPRTSGHSTEGARWCAPQSDAVSTRSERPC